MNSYELDQPLDLRLKALNLSRTFHHDQTNHHATNGLHHHSMTVNNLMVGAYCQVNSCASLTIANTYQNCMTNSRIGGQILNPPHINHHSQANPLQHTAPQVLGQHQQQNNPSLSHLGSVNIHCQPLNHHQPHPLSRLHPPSHLQAPPPVSQHQQHNLQSLSPGHQHQHQHQSPADGTKLISDPQSPQVGQNFAHQQSASAAATAAAAIVAAQQRQSSPLQHSYHHQPTPMRSLSMSSQVLSPGRLSRMVPPTLTPPILATSQQHHMNQSSQSSSFNLSHDNQQSTNNTSANVNTKSNDIPHQQLIKLSAAVSQASGSRSSSYDSGISSSYSNSSSISLFATTTTTATTNASLTTKSSASSTNNNNDNNNTVSPITRQHSLVSRYNCKPCGIVFSQPETLRAHQEGYCTKRDRSQTVQMRSQSAISPSAIQQTTSNVDK